MLNITHHPDRSIEEGQYYIELIDFADIPHNLNRVNRLGYWCDKPHLKTICVSMLKYFNEEMIQFLLSSRKG